MYKEYTRPLEQQIDTDKNIFSVLDERANRTPNDSLVEYKNEHGEWSSFSATEFRAKVIAIAKGLIAQGIMPGESVSIISHTCWQWTALDVAIMSIGALTVPVYETNSPAQVKMIFNDANVKMAFAEDDAQRDKIESIRNECSNLGDVYVIGLGAIGQLVANAATHLGMEVYGYDPYISVDAAWNLSRDIHHIQNVEDIYRTCDYITIHVPLMDSTKGMINKAAIDEMKDGVVLLNYARDLLVDEDAVLEALKAGKMKKYVTDFANPKVVGAEGTIVTPHLGASTKESEDNCAVMAVKEIRDFLENGNIKNSVNFPNCDMGVCTGAGRVTICHKNIPGMLGAFTTVMGNAGVNISDMTNKGKGDYAYTMMDLESEATEEIVKALEAVDGVLRVRIIK